jgi:hydrophobe/amphiphile efflux-3 (HAE3) family protein
MKTVVRLLSMAVAKAPAIVVVAVVGITVALGLYIPQQEQAGTIEAFAPDSPEWLALETIIDEFAGAEIAIEVIIQADDVITVDAVKVAVEVEEIARNGSAARYLNPIEDEDVVGFHTPIVRALEAQGIPESEWTDAAVKEGMQLASAVLTEAQSDRLEAALSWETTDLDVPSSTAGIVLISLIAPEDFDVEQQAEIAGAVEADLAGVGGEGIEVSIFARELLLAQDTLQRQINDLMRKAAVIIVIILGFVMWVRASGRLNRRRAARRTIADVAVASIAVAMTLVWVLGASVLLGPRYLGVIGRSNAISRIVPVLLIGLGVDYAIHLTARYREEVGAGLAPAQAIGKAIRSVGLALVLGALTTAVGFLTNVVNPVPALRDFGVLAAVGIIGAFLIMTTFVPAVRLLLDRWAARRDRLPAEALGRHEGGPVGRFVGTSAVLAERYSVWVVVAALVAAGLGGFGLSRLQVRFSLTDFVPRDEPALLARDILLEQFGGGFGEQSHLLVEGDVASVEVHNALVDAVGDLPAVEGVVTFAGRAAAESPLSVIEGLVSADEDFAGFAADAGIGADLRATADADIEAVYRRALQIAPDEMGSVVAEGDTGDLAYADVRITTQAGEEGALRLGDDLAATFATVDELPGVSVQATSERIVEQSVQEKLAASQVMSLAFTLAAAMALLVATFAYEARRPFLGVITIIPVALVVLWTYGMMAATGIPFSPATATVAALSIGIGVDYSIHLVNRYLEDRTRLGTTTEALRSTATHTGGALTGAALTTLAGFGVLVTSTLLPFQQLGGVIVFAIGFSLVASVVALPSMLTLWDGWHCRRGRHPVARLVSSSSPSSLPK